MAERTGNAAHDSGRYGAAAVRSDDDEIRFDFLCRINEECPDLPSAGADDQRGVKSRLAKFFHLALELHADLGLVGKHRCAAGATLEQLVCTNGDDARAVAGSMISAIFGFAARNRSRGLVFL